MNGRLLPSKIILLKVCLARLSLAIPLLCFFLLSTVLKAENLEPIDISTHTSGDSTGNQYLYFQSTNHQIELQTVIQQNQWKVPDADIHNRGFSDASSWMKFSLQNPSDNDVRLILEYVDASAQQIAVYHRKQQTDDAFYQQAFIFNEPVSTRPISFYRPAFPITLAAQESYEVYVHIAQGFEFPMHSFTKMRIWQEDDFYRATHVELLFLLILLNTEILMGLATLFVFFTTRDTVFLYYTVFAFSAASLFAGLSGLWGYFLTPNYYELWMVVLQINICQITAVLFVRRFLNIKQHLPRINMLMLAVVWIDILGVVLNLFGHPYLSRIIIDYTAFAYLLLAPVGLYAHKKGVPHALLFTASWAVFIVGMALASLRYRGYIADTFMAEWLIYIGGFIEIFLLTTIMVLRVRDMQTEKHAAEENHRRYLENAALELTQKVNEQTQLLQEAAKKAELEARTDILTGLANRRSFFESAKTFIERANRREPANLFLLMIDIDHFKKVNDTYGHAAGDKVLIQVAQVLAKTVRSVDMVARLGGEEFGVFIEDSNVEQAAELSRRLLNAVRELYIAHEEFIIRTTISIGLTPWEKGSNLDNAMHKADEALYKAKQMGRDQISLSR